MAARANWKGVLKAGEVSCPVALYTAASTAERIAFHILNRKTGHRVHREFVDAETGERVEAKEQVKGYETGPGDYIAFEPEEIAKAVLEADKTPDVEAGRWLRRGIELGCKFSINPDAHSTSEIASSTRSGLAIARKSGMPADRVINT